MEGLWTARQEEWDDVDIEVVNKVVQGMEKQCQALVLAGGWSFGKWDAT